MQEVTAASLLRLGRRLNRRAERQRLGLFMVEGPHAIEMAIRQRADIRGVLIDASAPNSTKYYYQNLPCFVLPTSEFTSVSNTVNSQGVTAIVKTWDIEKFDGIENFRFGLYLDEIQDPGNLGTMIRTADAFGASAVFLSPGCVDVFNDKVVRSSAGSIFNLPIVANVDKTRLKSFAEQSNLNIFVTDKSGDIEISDLDFNFKSGSIWVIGNEARGVSSDSKAIATNLVRIDMLGPAESLNAAAAATVCLYLSGRHYLANKV